MRRVLNAGIPCALIVAAASLSALSDPLPPDTTYRPLPARPFSAVKADDEAQKPRVMARQRALLEERYDLSDRPMPGAMMSGGTKPVQHGVRVKLAKGQTWQGLAEMSPGEIRDRNLLPNGLLPLPHVKQATGKKFARSAGRRGVISDASTSISIFPITLRQSSRHRFS